MQGKIAMNFKIKIGLSVLNVLFLLCLYSPQTLYAKPDAPPYAKWGRLAMETAMEKYPNADIVDYLHIGREDKGNIATERFKLWAKEAGQEFGIYIDIDFDPKNDKVIKISTRQSAT